MSADVHVWKRQRRRGFLLLEIMLGIGVFAVFMTAVTSVVLVGQENTVMGGDRIRGLYATLRAITASRSIRDAGFASLTVGNHGVTLSGTGAWRFSGTQSTQSGGFTTRVAVSSLASDWVSLLTETKWKHGRFQSGSVIVRTELTNWRTTGSIGNWTSPSLEGSYVSGGTPLFSGMAIAGNYAFVPGDTSSGGTGLYVFDISNTASPSLTTSFALGTSGIAAAVKGTTLYVITGSSSQEIRAYNVSTPASPTLLTSYNLSGSSLATSLALDGQTLYVGASVNASYDELYAFDVTNTGAIVYRDSFNVDATVNAVALEGTGAYLAVNDSSAEMKVVDIEDPSSLMLASGGTYNITSTEVGRSVAVTGTSALLGRQKGTAIQELVLLDASGAGGPWYHEGSGSLVGLGTDPLSCYGFLAADSSGKAFQVADLRDRATFPELWSYNSTSGQARALHYDPVRDRVFVLTRRALLIFRPAASTGSCT